MRRVLEMGRYVIGARGIFDRQLHNGEDYRIKTSGGYLLTGQYTEVKSSVPGESSMLSELLEYAEIDGVRLPSKLTAIVSLEGAPGGKSRTIQFTFRDFQIQKGMTMCLLARKRDS